MFVHTRYKLLKRTGIHPTATQNKEINNAAYCNEILASFSHKRPKKREMWYWYPLGYLSLNVGKLDLTCIFALTTHKKFKVCKYYVTLAT